MDTDKTRMQLQNRKELASIWKEFRLQAIIVAVAMGVMGLLVGIDSLFSGVNFAQAGISPRELSGLPAIFYAHFLHLDATHLMVNAVPFVTLAWLVMLRDTRDFFVVSAFVMLVCGGAVWLLSPGGIERVGSGGLIFGYLGCLLAWLYYERRTLMMIVAAAVGFMYSGAILAVVPFSGGYWIGGFFGLVAGFLAARFLSRHFNSRLTRSVTDEP